jgi:sRNA-binding protein
MSRRRPPTELLPLLAEAFPRVFFTDPAQVQPLKVGIDQDLLGALPEGVTPKEAKGFLHGYVNRAAYQKALLHGQGRIDLTGAVVEGEIPAEIREQARERWLQLQAAQQKAKAGQPPGKRPTAQPGQPRPATPATPLNLEEQYAMAIDAKLEVTMKFSTLPNARPAGQGKMAFALKTPGGQLVTVTVPNKARPVTFAHSRYVRVLPWYVIPRRRRDWPDCWEIATACAFNAGATSRSTPARSRTLNRSSPAKKDTASWRIRSTGSSKSSAAWARTPRQSSLSGQSASALRSLA